MLKRLRKYLEARREEYELRILRDRWRLPEKQVSCKFSLDGRPRAVQVNLVADYGRQWINSTIVKPFGLESSNWKGRLGKRKKQGLRRQTEKMLRVARQHKLLGRAPRVIVRFGCGVSRPVAQALRTMGAEVEGEIIEPPPPRAEREAGPPST